MTILVVNDDGYQSVVSNNFVLELRAQGYDVYSFFPKQNYSGAGSSITLSKPIRYYRTSPMNYIVQGTSTDCCLLGLEMVPSPGLIISGINKGLNIGLARKYSGTLGAMKEGIARDIPCISISADEDVYRYYIATGKFNRLIRLIEYYKEKLNSRPVYGLNLNIASLRNPGTVKLERDIAITKGSLLKIHLKEDEKSFSYLFNQEITNISLNGDLLVGFVYDPFYYSIVNEKSFVKKISKIWNRK